MLFPRFVYHMLYVLGYLTTSEHQMWRVMPLKTPFGFVIGFITISLVVTTRNYYTVTHLHSIQSLHANISFYLFGASGIHLENFETPLFKFKVTLRLTVGQSVSQSVSLGVEPHLGIMTRYLLLFDSYGLVIVGRPLWREDRSVFCQNHCLH
jgi:hypothetical protein